MKTLIIPLTCMFLTSCAETQAIRTSADTMLIQTSGAPACGVQGSMRVAQQMVAIETIRAGYDKYLIIDGNAQNNVTTQTMPGTYHTNGNVLATGNYASYSGTTSYQPGPTIFNGSNDVIFHVKMFKRGQKGSSKALSAKEMLGPQWEELVQNGVDTCS